jgi:hypothetical protein
MADSLAVPVEAYWNLHGDCVSFRERGGRVQHADWVLIEDARFAVQPKGREKVLNEQRKNVHAFVRGQLLEIATEPPEVSGWDVVTYRPYTADFFFFVDSGLRVDAAPLVWIGEKQILVGR